MNQILHGDALDVLKTLEDESVDVVVTDPPYFLINESGSGFMGKSWDGIMDLWQYLWLDNTFVKSVERLFLDIEAEPSTVEGSIVQGSVSIEPLVEQNSESVLSVKTDLVSTQELQKDFAQVLVLTKHDLLDLLNESSPGLMRAREGLLSGVSEIARFVLPLSLLGKALTNTVAATALNGLIRSGCAGTEIQLSLTDAARTSVAIAATTGKLSDAKSISEITGLVSIAADIADERKFSATTLSLTDRAAATKCLTLLLFAFGATRSSKETQYSLVDNFFTVTWRECLRVLKPGAFAFVCMTPRQDIVSRAMLSMQNSGFVTNFTSLFHTYASGFPKAMNIGKMVDKRNGVAPLAKAFNTAGKGDRPDLQDAKQNLSYRGDYGYKHKLESEEAKALDGSYGGFQPKPAVEVVIVAMKPLSEKTYVDQALKNGKGITWLDDCRIPTGENLNGGAYSGNERGGGEWKEGSGFKNDALEGEYEQPTGRFPANLLVEQDVLGSHSRFFSLDEWAQTLPFLICPKASKSEKNYGVEDFEAVSPPDRLKDDGIGGNNPRNRTNIPKKNHHPTVKPLKLMSYLITLGSRPGDVVCDPFAGSGSTLVAAKQLGRNYIGVEMEREYCDIAEARLAAVQPTLLTTQQTEV